MRWHSDRKPIFSQKHEQVLQKTVVTANGPGTILRDFEALLGYVKERDLFLTAGYQLPRRSLPEINARLAHPIQMGLEHPLQKSYPHVHGLYLLLRASGLTFVDETGKKPRLVVDAEVERSWTGLNPAERYGTLLEAWLLRGHPEIIGEQAHGMGQVPENFPSWSSFFSEIPGAGLPVGGDPEAKDRLHFSPDWHNLGLLDLMGLIEVRPGPLVPGQGWQIEMIKRTPWGDALRALLHDLFLSDSFRHAIGEAERSPCGVLRPPLQPYLPEWKKDLTLPEEEFRPGIYIFRVSRRNMWRQVALPAEMTLDELAAMILEAVEFENDHLYRFSYEDRFGIRNEINHPELDAWRPPEERCTDVVLVGDLPLRVGQTMVFLFDFGESWEFDVTLEQVNPDADIAVVLKGSGWMPRQYR